MAMEEVIQKMISTQESGSVSTTCDVCGESLFMDIEILGKMRTVRCVCECEKEEYQKRKEWEKNQKKIQRLEKLRKYSLMDDRFEGCTLEAWSDDIGNAKLKRIVERYIEHWTEMLESNIGLLVHGDPGIGKTHAAFTIANEIIDRYNTPVIAISSIGLLSRIKETYAKYGNEAEIDIINRLKNAQLLIIDDFGAEQKTVWATSMLYQIIDSRYRSGKPMFITTNLTLKQLQEKLTADDGIDRIYDRIVEACQPVEVKGKSNRAKVAKEKQRMLIDLLKDERSDS